MIDSIGHVRGRRMPLRIARMQVEVHGSHVRYLVCLAAICLLRWPFGGPRTLPATLVGTLIFVLVSELHLFAHEYGHARAARPCDLERSAVVFHSCFGEVRTSLWGETPRRLARFAGMGPLLGLATAALFITGGLLVELLQPWQDLLGDQVRLGPEYFKQLSRLGVPQGAWPSSSVGTPGLTPTTVSPILIWAGAWGMVSDLLSLVWYDGMNLMIAALWGYSGDYGGSERVVDDWKRYNGRTAIIMQVGCASLLVTIPVAIAAYLNHILPATWAALLAILPVPSGIGAWIVRSLIYLRRQARLLGARVTVL